MGRVTKTLLIERDAILTRVLITENEYARLKALARETYRMPTAEYLGDVLRAHLEAEEEANSDAA